MFKSAKAFRQGTGLHEAEEAETLATAQQSDFTGTSSGFRPAHPAARLPTALDGAGAHEPGSHAEVLREYPAVPYYGLLSSLTVQVNVAADGGTEDGDVVERRRQMNDSSVERTIPAIERLLMTSVEQQGSTYVLSNCGCDHGHREVATEARATGTAPLMSYGDYVNALTAVFREFHRLRSAGAVGSGKEGAAHHQHHTLHVRVSHHPRWRDVSALLALEQGRLLLFLSSSSRATQRYLQQRTEELAQSLPWVAGAALATEPPTLSPTAVNPLLAAWHAFMNLPLVSAGGLAPPASSQTQAPLDGPAALAVTVAARALEGFAVSIVSSLAFSKATRHTPRVRLVGVAPLLSAASLSTSSEGAGDAPSAAARPHQMLVGRQFTWRVSLPSESAPARAERSSSSSSSAAAATPPLLVPNLLSTVVACLVQSCGLRSFSIITSASEGGSFASGSTDTDHEGESGRGARGLTYVGVAGNGRPPGGATAQRGPSSQSWTAYSRLSSAAWLSDDERRVCGLMEVGEDGEDIPLECEFHLDGIHFRRSDGEQTAATRTRKRSRSRGDAEADTIDGADEYWSSGGGTHQGGSVTGRSVAAMASTLQAHAGLPLRVGDWGRSFRALFTVTRIMDVPSDEDEASGGEP